MTYNPDYTITHVSLIGRVLKIWLRGCALHGRNVVITPVRDGDQLIGLTARGPTTGSGSRVEQYVPSGRNADKPAYGWACVSLPELVGTTEFGKTAVDGGQAEGGNGHYHWDIILPDPERRARPRPEAIRAALGAPQSALAPAEPMPPTARVAGFIESVSFVRETNARIEALGLTGLLAFTKGGKMVIDGVRS